MKSYPLLSLFSLARLFSTSFFSPGSYAAGISSHPNAAGISSSPNAIGISSSVDAVGISSHSDAMGIPNENVPWPDLPAVVQQVITENAEGGNIQAIEKEAETAGADTISVYEAGIIKADGSKMKIKVGEDGQLIGIDRN